MAKEKWRSEVRLTSGGPQVRAGREAEEERSARPFVIVVLGDWCGTSAGDATGGSAARSGTRLVGVDRDNFDAVMASLAPTWVGSAGDAVKMELSFRELDDFHPDRLLQAAAPLRKLLETRGALRDPARFDEVAGDVARWAGRSAAEVDSPAEPAIPPVAPKIPASGLLDQILDEQDAPGAPRSVPRRPDGALERFVADILAPYVVKRETPQQTELVRGVEEALTKQLHAVLSDAGFQRLEAAWRGLDRLVRSLASDVELKVYLLQCGRDDLTADLVAAADPADSLIGRVLTDAKAAGNETSPALLIGDYAFDTSYRDLVTLERLGRLGALLGAPFVGAAGPGLLGCESFRDLPGAAEIASRFGGADAEAWSALRQSAGAPSVALALPRVLGRLPYGSKTEPIDSFPFEEAAEGLEVDHLLWTNPAFAVAEVVARVFGAEGWPVDLAGRVQQIEDLPLFVYREGGEAVAVPCGEAPLGDRVVEALEEAGLTPLTSSRGLDVVQLSCVQSLAVPRRPLKWGDRC